MGIYMALLDQQIQSVLIPRQRIKQLQCLQGAWCRLQSWKSRVVVATDYQNKAKLCCCQCWGCFKYGADGTEVDLGKISVDTEFLAKYLADVSAEDLAKHVPKEAFEQANIELTT